MKKTTSKVVKVGDIVRHTGKFLSSIGSAMGPVDGIVVGWSGLGGGTQYPVVVWSDDPEQQPRAVHISAIEIDKAGMAKSTESYRAALAKSLLGKAAKEIRDEIRDESVKSNPTRSGHHLFDIEDEVAPRRPTKDGLTHGRVADIGRDARGWYYEVEWPEIGSTGGGWRDDDLIALRPRPSASPMYHPGIRRKTTKRNRSR